MRRESVNIAITAYQTGIAQCRHRCPPLFSKRRPLWFGHQSAQQQV